MFPAREKILSDVADVADIGRYFTTSLLIAPKRKELHRDIPVYTMTKSTVNITLMKENLSITRLVSQLFFLFTSTS